MKKLCGCIFFLVLFFSCTKDEKTTVQQEAVSPKVFVPGELSKYVGSYSKFDKDWNLLICDIYQKDTCYYTTITYKDKVITSPLTLFDDSSRIYSFLFEKENLFLSLKTDDRQNNFVRIMNNQQDNFLNITFGKGFVDLEPKTEENKKLKKELDIHSFRSKIRPKYSRWSSRMNYMDTLRYIDFDDNSYYMKAVFETKQKDTVSLTYDIPIDRECLGRKMEVVWKIDTFINRNKKPVLNQKMLRYRLISRE